MYFEMDCACKGKNLDKMIQPGILMILYNKSLHGFAIISELSKTIMFDGDCPDKAGVYRYLKKMEESGLLNSEWDVGYAGDRPRKIYSITDHGRECLINWQVVLNEYSAKLKRLSNDIGRIGK